MTIRIRPMEPGDATAYLETLRASIVGVASAAYPSEVIRSWAPSVTKESIDRLLDNPDRDIRVVAELDGEVVGIGSLGSKAKEQRACYVSPAGLRKGVGRAIVRELERLARSYGVEQLELIATIHAEPFYARLGYRSGERVQHVTSGGVAMAAIKMSRVLNPLGGRLGSA